MPAAPEEVGQDVAEAAEAATGAAPPQPPKPPPGNPPPKIPPPESYCLRFSGSDRIAYAPWTSLNRSSASLSPWFVSGWYLRASLR